MQKKLVSTLAASAVLLFLVGCTPGSNEAQGGGDACAPTASGSSSEKIKATGDFGTAPKVTFTDPLTSKATERSVLIKGDGDAVASDGSTVTVQYSAYNATSGDEIEVTSYKKDGAVPFTLTDGQLLPGLLKALNCSTVGDRIATVIPPSDAFGETGSTQVGVGASDSIVFVLDVEDVAGPVKALPKADGKDQPLPDGFPAVGVTLAEDGAPTIAIPAATPAPTELQLATLKLGDGAKVVDGDTVVAAYTGVVWNTGTVFDSSWDRGAPAEFPTNGVVPGFSKALVGATVGSQVLAIIPPAEGYGDSPREGSGITATDTLVFVVDILAIK